MQKIVVPATLGYYFFPIVYPLKMHPESNGFKPVPISIKQRWSPLFDSWLPRQALVKPLPPFGTASLSYAADAWDVCFI